MIREDIEFARYQKRRHAKRTRCPYCKAPVYSNYKYCDQCGKML